MSKKILVVDDEKDYVRVIKQTLTNEGYEVITAFNGKEAIEKVRNEAPNLMILDINMPGIGGYEVCKKLREDPLYKRLPIIMLTVRKDIEDQVKGMKLGSDEYMIKPFDPEELLLRVKNILQVSEK